MGNLLKEYRYFKNSRKKIKALPVIFARESTKLHAPMENIGRRSH
jgi:hypothetical protein